MAMAETITSQDDLLCDAATGKCDTHPRCPVWASEGECSASRSYMREHCPGACAMEATISKPKSTTPCRDALERCGVWAELGECETNAEEMRKHCPRSCGICDGDSEDEIACTDSHPKCDLWAGLGECDKNPTYMHEHCAKSCDTCDTLVSKKKKQGQEIKPKEKTIQKSSSSNEDDLMKQSKLFGEAQRAEGDEKQRTLERIEATISYMNSEPVRGLPHKVRSGCLNRHDLCTFWAVSFSRIVSLFWCSWMCIGSLIFLRC